VQRPFALEMGREMTCFAALPRCFDVAASILRHFIDVPRRGPVVWLGCDGFNTCRLMEELSIKTDGKSQDIRIGGATL